MAKLCDVNVFVNAHRRENQGHEFFNNWLMNLLEGSETYYYCEWILSAFVRIVTHPRIYKTPTPLDIALEFSDTVRSQPQAVGIMPGAKHWNIFRELCTETEATGNQIPDVYLAALSIEAGAVWVSSDADFKRYEPRLTWQLLLPFEDE